jgi:hypothetical protein
VLTYSKEEYLKWKNGDRETCINEYCKRLTGTRGFGEYIAGKYFEEQGYKWIHHDYNIFRGNKLGKYPAAEKIIIGCLGKEKFEDARILYRGFKNKTFKNIEEPDLLVYKPEFSEIRFVECKHLDTRDKMNEKQIRGLILISVLLGCTVEIFEIVEDNKIYKKSEIVWDLK